MLEVMPGVFKQVKQTDYVRRTHFIAVPVAVRTTQASQGGAWDAFADCSLPPKMCVIEHMMPTYAILSSANKLEGLLYPQVSPRIFEPGQRTGAHC